MALRFGLEIEYHGIRFTLRRRADGMFWQRPAPPGLLEASMIALDPILQPLNVGADFYAGDGGINWESDWGFRAVADGFSRDSFTVGGLNYDSVSTVLELATAAAPVTDHAYWITARKCSQMFVQSINDFHPNNWGLLPAGTLPLPADPVQPFLETGSNVTWIPIQAFVNVYNAKLAALALAPAGINGLPVGVNIDRFKLAKSQELLSFENRTRPGYLGETWDAFVCFRGADRDQWADVQVNYQLGLRSLHDNLNLWVDSWNSEWITALSLARIPVDPPIGDIKPVALGEPDRVQYFAAMWKRAKQLMDADFLGGQLGNAAWNGLGVVNSSLMKALIMYVLVCSSITNPLGQTETTTSKNRYPQLCKTSPQSIKAAINLLFPAVPPAPSRAAIFWQRLPTLVATNKARTEGSDTLRLTQNLVNNGCIDANARPANSPDIPKYVDTTPDILNDPVPDFNQMWIGSFKDHTNPPDTAGALPLALTAGNKFGFDNANPFWCRWAHGVHSSYPAQVFNVNDIKVLFESRYSRCMMNIGFNPYVDPFLFNRSYRRLVVLLAGVGADGAIAGQVATHFPDRPAVQQNFTAGRH
ncbi:hypothetical protein B0H66DRAFT_400255 [Apodospora peruviana]|uniref:Uncharacterized protein n=1 Tax=Apodospora peruviana TaxID=516989 RepID=A0AAE0HTC4_9PEZI|nr:hypothetical protein B0H66DRAFT_400255 [Apodospora peruviana]